MKVSRVIGIFIGRAKKRSTVMVVVGGRLL